jgi:hypothetical protein
MSSTSNPRIQLIDADGDPIDDSSGKLNVVISNCEMTDGADAPAKGLLVGGVDPAGDFEPLLVDPTGALQVDIAGIGSSITLATGGYGEIETRAEITVGASNTQLASDASSEVIIQASYDNSGYIVVGDTNITATRGIRLYAGDSISLNVTNSDMLYARGSTSGQKLNVLVLHTS